MTDGVVDIEEVHKEACLAGLRHYIDPVTGYLAFTALEHRERGVCCGQGCRHCPYGHALALPRRKTAGIKQSILVRSGPADPHSDSCVASPLRLLAFDGGETSRELLAELPDDPDRILLAFISVANGGTECGLGSKGTTRLAVDGAVEYGCPLLAVVLAEGDNPYSALRTAIDEEVPGGESRSAVRLHMGGSFPRLSDGGAGPPPWLSVD